MIFDSGKSALIALDRKLLHQLCSYSDGALSTSPGWPSHEQPPLDPSPFAAVLSFARTWQRSIDIIRGFQRLTISPGLPLRIAFSSILPPSWPEELNLTHLLGLPPSFDIVYR